MSVLASSPYEAGRSRFLVKITVSISSLYSYVLIQFSCACEYVKGRVGKQVDFLPCALKVVELFFFRVPFFFFFHFFGAVCGFTTE